MTFAQLRRYIETIRKRLSPGTGTMINEIGIISADDIAQADPNHVAKPIPDTYLRELLRPSPAIQKLNFRQILKRSCYPVRQVHLLDSEGNSFYFFDSNCPTY